MNRTIIISLWLFFTFLFFWIHHNRTDQMFTYHGEIFSDKSGYYIYLPFFLNYDGKVDKLPKDIENKTGKGFSIKNGKLLTKYTSGVAILQLPFYLIAEGLYYVVPTGYKGFSIYHHKFIAFSGLFFSWIGFWFLFRFLNYYYKSDIAFLTIITLLTTTNILYYQSKEPNYSHIYSFFLISTFLFLLKKTDFLKQYSIKDILFISACSAMIILIRPTNVLLLVISFTFLDNYSLKNSVVRLKQLKNVLYRYFWLIFFTFLVVFTPQFLYWKYAFGNYVVYSYGNEGFNWLKPQILPFLFSPDNGAFIFTPLLIFVLLGAFLMIYTKNYNGYLVLITFFVMVYLYSSWWIYSFGCSYGSRNFVDMYPLLSLGISHIYYTTYRNTRLLTLIIFIVFILAVLNIRTILRFDTCMYIEHEWDWGAWLKLVFG